jgi:uncharacterized OsmC-like protein
MGRLNARALIVRDYAIVLDNGRPHAVIVDQSTETFSGLGPTPLELCVMSHAGCYATIAALTARKMRLQLQGCDVRVEAVKDPVVGTITEEVLRYSSNSTPPKRRFKGSTK